MNFPFFLGTTTIGDNEVASSTCCINLVANNLYVLFNKCNIVWIHSIPNVMCQ